MTILFVISLFSFIVLAWLIREPLLRIRNEQHLSPEKVKVSAALAPFVVRSKRAAKTVFVTVKGYVAPLGRLVVYKGGEFVHLVLVRTASFASKIAASIRGRGVIRKDLSPSHFFQEILEHHNEMRAQVARVDTR